MIISTLSRM
uniref:Uncharacterized protein n=1 Tax=Anguilla anguilla TaxID=7936 RepID=A0A0E9P5X8_ANGAN